MYGFCRNRRTINDIRQGNEVCVHTVWYVSVRHHHGVYIDDVDYSQQQQRRPESATTFCTPENIYQIQLNHLIGNIKATLF